MVNLKQKAGAHTPVTTNQKPKHWNNTENSKIKRVIKQSTESKHAYRSRKPISLRILFKLQNIRHTTPLNPGKAGKSSFWMLNSWFCWTMGLTPRPCFRKEPEIFLFISYYSLLYKMHKYIKHKKTFIITYTTVLEAHQQN